jgi:hypothetical protein
MSEWKVPPLTDDERIGADVPYVCTWPSPDQVSHHYGIWLPIPGKDGHIAVTEWTRMGSESGLLRGVVELERYHQTPLSPLLNHLGLWAAASQQDNRLTGRAGLPAVSSVIDRMATLNMPVGHELPRIIPYDGLSYDPEEGLLAIANDGMLASTYATQRDLASAHDATVHIPVWSALPPAVRNGYARVAQDTLNDRFGNGKNPRIIAMRSLDVAISYVGVGKHLSSPDDYRRRTGLAETYAASLGVSAAEAADLTVQTFKHVAVIGEVALLRAQQESPDYLM